MAKAFPKTLHLKVEDGGSGPDYLMPYADLIDTAVMGKTIKVGVYTLTETVEVKGVAVTNTVKTTRQRR